MADTDAPTPEEAETSPTPPTGTIVYTFELNPNAQVYDIMVPGGHPGELVIEVPRRFWFGNRKVTIPLPGYPSVILWRADATTNEVTVVKKLATVGLARRDG